MRPGESRRAETLITGHVGKVSADTLILTGFSVWRFARYLVFTVGSGVALAAETDVVVECLSRVVVFADSVVLARVFAARE